MSVLPPDTEELLRLSQAGEVGARNQLLDRHRDRLRRMIAIRIDHRLAARLDSSDILQEVLIEANRRLEEYWQKRPLPFYPWLRQLAIDRLMMEYRRHLKAQRRSVRREEIALGLSNQSAQQLAEKLLACVQSPSVQAEQKELQKRVRQALDQLPEQDREVLLLRFLEQLSAQGGGGSSRHQCGRGEKTGLTCLTAA